MSNEITLTLEDLHRIRAAISLDWVGHNPAVNASCKRITEWAKREEQKLGLDHSAMADAHIKAHTDKLLLELMTV